MPAPTKVPKSSGTVLKSRYFLRILQAIWNINCRMKRGLALVVLALLLEAGSFAQELPVGTMLPVQLNTTLRAEKLKAGDRVSGKLAQYVDVNGIRLPRGTEVTGKVVQAAGISGSSPARLALVFDGVRIQGRDVPITTSLRALASMQAVYEAELPTNDITDFGSTIRDWNTTQIGGQAVYRGDGKVMDGADVVGRATMVGEVFGTPKTWPWSACMRDRASNTIQSFWVFSTDACGVYGLEGLKLAHAGRTEPVGQIMLEAPRKLEIRGGSGWLLVVVGEKVPAGSASKNSHDAGVSDSIEAQVQP